jgi:cephalosporin-C deacetylase-like acetyl esterase
MLSKPITESCPGHVASPLDVSCTPVDSGLVAVETFDVSFAGYGGNPARAWLHLPARALRGDGALPGVVRYQGYNGGRGMPREHVFRASAGFAHLVADTRGSYFDGAMLGRRSSAPALFSVTLMDEICPPSTVFAAYHAYGGPKDIRGYPFNDHEGGEAFQQCEQLTWLRGQVGV